MNTTTIMHLSELDHIGAYLMDDTTLIINFGTHASLMIRKDRNPEYFAKWCDFFDLKETAPSGEAGDGVQNEKTHTENVGG